MQNIGKFTESEEKIKMQEAVIGSDKRAEIGLEEIRGNNQARIAHLEGKGVANLTEDEQKELANLLKTKGTQVIG